MRPLIALLLIAPAAAQPREVSEIIPAPPAQVWQALTSTEGVLKWQCAKADLRLEPGAIWRTRYSPDGPLGDENTIFNRLLSYDPERMYSLQIEKPPAKFPFMNTYRQMWTVVYLEPIPPGSTKVTCRSLGLPDSEEGRKMGDFFERGNLYTLQQLKKHLSQP